MVRKAEVLSIDLKKALAEQAPPSATTTTRSSPSNFAGAMSSRRRPSRPRASTRCCTRTTPTSSPSLTRRSTTSVPSTSSKLPKAKQGTHFWITRARPSPSQNWTGVNAPTDIHHAYITEPQARARCTRPGASSRTPASSTTWRTTTASWTRSCPRATSTTTSMAKLGHPGSGLKIASRMVPSSGGHRLDVVPEAELDPLPAAADPDGPSSSRPRRPVKPPVGVALHARRPRPAARAGIQGGQVSPRRQSAGAPRGRHHPRQRAFEGRQDSLCQGMGSQASARSSKMEQVFRRCARAT
jgi:hypothetical protein